MTRVFLQRTLFAVALFATTFVSAAVSAEDDLSEPDTYEPGDYSEEFNGVFYGIGAFAGPTLMMNDAFEDTMGVVYGAKFRISLVLQLVDLHLAYHHTAASPTAGEHTYDVSTDSLSTSFGIHPFFLVFFDRPPLRYLLGSIYILGGGGLELAEFRWGTNSYEESWKIGFHMGFGADYPITSPDAGYALWLGFQYRLNFVPTEMPVIDAANESYLRQHIFAFDLSLKFNGLPF